MAGLILSLSACNGFTIPWFSRPTANTTVTATPKVISGQAEIIIQMNAFHPEKLTVRAGTKITWVNKDPSFHSVIADGGQFQSGLLALGQAFVFTFDTPGTYSYYCGVAGKSLSGEINVVP